MKAKREYRDRDTTEVAVLDALVDRNGDGMTVFEIRSRVDADIDEIETALGSLKEEDLISVDHENTPVVIVPDERVIPDPDEETDDQTFLDRIRERLPL